jgi:hypothetical protein
MSIPEIHRTILADDPPTGMLDRVASGDCLGIVVANAVPPEQRNLLVAAIQRSSARVNHAQVPGLEVLGLSHFQAAMSVRDSLAYFSSADERMTWLTEVEAKMDGQRTSEVLCNYLQRLWPSGIERMRLPSKGLLAPFTIRIFGGGVGIEPHQDVLSAEASEDPLAASLVHQFSVNLYLETSSSGGELVLDRHIGLREEYRDLVRGPVEVPQYLLHEFGRIQPEAGDLIITSSYRVHSVTAVAPHERRITLSFFLGELSTTEPLRYWA